MQGAEVEDVHEKTRGEIRDWSAHVEEGREEPNQIPYAAQFCYELALLFITL